MSELREPLNFLYPSEKAKKEMKERRYKLSQLSDTYIDDLMIKKLARYFSPENFNFSESIFREMCDDKEIINYRLDEIDDLIKFPKLSPAILKAVNTIIDNHRDNLSAADKKSPDTFSALSDRIESLDIFINAVNEIVEYYNNEGNKVSAEGFKRFFEYFLEIYSSESFKNLREDTADLKEAFSKRIRCVTVAINFNEEMRPISAGIVSISEKAATEKPSVFDRIFYRNAKYSDVNVKNLHTKYMGDSKDPNEIDKKLFEELEKVTSDYMGKLNNALEDYKQIDYSEIKTLAEGISFLQKSADLVLTARSKGIEMCRPVILPAGERKLLIKGAFDVNFFRSVCAAKPYDKGESLLVTNDISFDENASFYLLSGANNGGKTTFVRAVGLCVLFSQAGLFAPASSCEISPVDYIFTHFPKEEEVGINTSRFTEEVKDLKKIAESVTENSFLLMNESIQSTTPKECLEIAGEFVRIFTILGVRGIFATHLSELADSIDEINSDPDNHSRLDSIVVCVNTENGERTYHIKRSKPEKTSYASVIFDKFGISADEIRKKIHKN